MQARYGSYVFDAYGTLFDVHAAVRRHSAGIGPGAQALSEIWRAKQLEYTWVRTLMGAHIDFWRLTEEALDYAILRTSADARLKPALLDAYRVLDCYPEVPQILAALKARGARLAILSNGTPDMLATAVDSAGLGSLFDDIFSAEVVTRFKTDATVYRMASDAYCCAPADISFQSSNRWDVAGAVRFGFRGVWINRTGQPDEYADLAPSLVLASLAGLLA